MDSHRKLFVYGIKWCEYTGSSNIRWSKRKQKFETEIKPSSLRTRIWLHSACLSILIAGYISSYFNQFENPFVDQIFFGVALLLNTLLHCFLVSIKANSASICLYVNSIYDLGRVKAFQKLKKTSPQFSFRVWSSTVMAYIMSGSAAIFSFVFLYGLHFSNFFKPSIAGFVFLPNCLLQDVEYCPNILKQKAARLFVTVVLLAVNQWMWIFSLTAAPIGLSGITLLCTLSVSGLIERYGIKIEL